MHWASLRWLSALPKRRPGLDVVALLALVLISLLWVISDHNPYEKDWGRDTFFQRNYAPAVLSFCGRGFHSPTGPEVPALRDFLRLRSDTFSCSALPPELDTKPPNYHAVNYHYLFRAVELTWRLRGTITWKGIKPLFGLFLGVAVAATYGLFRLVTAPAWSFAAAVFVLPLHLRWLPFFRDYSKAPFVLALLLIIGILVRNRLGRRRMVLLAAASGLIMGAGLGFRPDVLVVVPPLLTAFLFVRLEPGRGSVVARSLAIAACLASTLAMSAPLAALEGGASIGSHVTLLGRANRFTEALGVDDSIYEWSHIYSDAWADFQIRSYSMFLRGDPDEVPYISERYDSLGRRLLLSWALGFPADIGTRAFASVVGLVGAPLLLFMGVAVSWRGSWLRLWALVAFLTYLAAFPAMQFQERHFFHLRIMPLWIVALIMSQLFALVGSPLEGAIWRERLQLAARAGLRKLGAFGVGWLVLFGCGVWGARLAQQSRVHEWLEGYEGAELGPLEESIVPLQAKFKVRLELDGLLVPLSGRRDNVSVGYLVLIGNRARCDDESVEVTLRYEAGAYHDFSRRFALDLLPVGDTRVFAPIYSRERSGFGDSRFLGVEIAKAQAACIELRRVKRLTDLAPLAFVRLPPDWKKRALYQKLEAKPSLAKLARVVSGPGALWWRMLRRPESG